MEHVAARAVRAALEAEDGDVLVFLPGAGEIRRVEEMLAADGMPPDTRVMPLFGNLAQEAQDEAIRPSPPGRRKVVLATSIAETSLTIEGVRVVVDSGLMRVPRFSPRTGMTRLETVRGLARLGRPAARARGTARPRASAIGCGRKPRMPRCSRIARPRSWRPTSRRWRWSWRAGAWPIRWSCSGSTRRPPPPSPRRASCWPSWARWTRPAPSPRTGAAMAALPLHPRLAHMLLRAKEMRLGATACDLAALLAERDVLRGDEPRARRRRAAAAGGAAPRARRRPPRRPRRRSTAHWPRRRTCAATWASRRPTRTTTRRACCWRSRIPTASRSGGRAAARATCCATDAAPPSPSRSPSPRSRTSWPPSSTTPAARGASIIAAPVDLADVERCFADQIVAERIRRVGRCGWRRARAAPGAAGRAGAARGAARRPRSAADRRRAGGGRPARGRGVARVVEGRGAASRAHRLPPRARRVVPRRVGRGAGRDDGRVAGAAPGRDAEDRGSAADRPGPACWKGCWRGISAAALDEWAPTHVDVPSGSRIPVDYADPAAPALAVRLQEVFGWTETPRIAGGRGAAHAAPALARAPAGAGHA